MDKIDAFCATISGALLNYDRCNLVDNVHYAMPSDHTRREATNPDSDTGVVGHDDLKGVTFPT
jgi:hypothetical protein